jgi:hypothetical protein
MDKVLIGTPIHQMKDYSMKRWLQSVRCLDWDNIHLLMVDNSPDPSYVDKIKGYCKEVGLTDYEIIHINPPIEEGEERIAYAREEIRKYLIKGDWDYWLSWECDVLVPPDALKQLMPFADKFATISHNYPARENPNDIMEGFGFTLIKRRMVEMFGFIMELGLCDPLMPNCYHGGESWFFRRCIRAGFAHLTIDNLFRTEHLAN